MVTSWETIFVVAGPGEWCGRRSLYRLLQKCQEACHLGSADETAWLEYVKAVQTHMEDIATLLARRCADNGQQDSSVFGNEDEPATI